MPRQSVNAWFVAPVMLFAILGWAMSTNAEIRSKSSGTKPRNSTPPKQEPVPATAGNSSNRSGESRERESLADDDSRPNSSDGKNSKSSVKKAQKGTPGSKPSMGRRSGRPRIVDPPSNQQGIVAPGLDLEPET